MQAVPGIVHGLQDPLGAILQLLTGVLSHVISTARGDLDHELTRYLFSTIDPSSPTTRPFTANPAVTRLNAAMAITADVLVGAVVVFASLRSIFEHQSLRPRYTLKMVLPRLLVAIALVHGSIYFIQMSIDLNNAIGQVAVSLGGSLSPDALPWSGTLGPASVQAIQVSQDLFHALFALALVVALVILVLTYVVRTALLEVLVVVAPLAALCTVLPDTRGFAKMWLRLFMVTVFMQAIQLIVLRVSVAAGFGAGDGLADSLYALAILWIMLKVPGTLHAATQFESKAHSLGRHVERSMRRALAPVHHAVHRVHA